MTRAPTSRRLLRLARAMWSLARGVFTRLARRWQDPRAQRLGTVVLVVVVLALIGIASFSDPVRRGPRTPLGAGAVDLAPLFANNARAKGASMTLVEVYEAGYDAWLEQAKGAADRLAPPSEVRAELERQAARATRVTLLDLLRIVAMESAGKHEIGVNRSGYAGLFQLGPAACEDVGATFDEIKRDWRKNADAGRRFVELIHKRLSDAFAKDERLAGVPVDAFLLYLAHQQGVSGAVAILRSVRAGDADAAPANSKLVNNLMPGGAFHRRLTSGGHAASVLEFFVFFRGAFDAVVERVR